MFASSELAPSSVELYTTRIQRWLTFLPPSLQDLDFLVVAPNRSLSYLSHALELSSSNTPTNRHCYISSIVALFSHSKKTIQHLPDIDSLQSQWISLQKENTKVITIRRLQNKPTETQEAKKTNSVSWSDVLAKRDTLEQGSLSHLLLSFYTYIYPLRADLFSIPILTTLDAASIKNYIRMTEKSSSLFIHDFKTAKKYGAIIYDPLPSELHEILKVSLKLHPREYLFADARGQPFSRDGFSKWSNRILSRLFDTAISLSTLRHLFISTLDFNMAAEKLQEIGNKMGHSLSMQKLYQWKEDA